MILVTGWSGTIGKAIVNHLSAQGRELFLPMKGERGVGEFEAMILAHGTYGYIGKLRDATMVQWRKAFEVNVFLCVEYIQQATATGPIIVMGGAAGGRIPFKERSAYAASKAALNAIVLTGAAEGLPIYGIAPGPQHSKMQETLLASDASDGVKEDVRESLRRSHGTSGVLKVVDAILAGRAEPGHFYTASEWRE
jgi:NAD(P)-dependent dehydrogenase (short-subunit alcohol dehydrogenase family)